MEPSKRNRIIVAALLGATTIALEAFGAHALKSSLSSSSIETYKTACDYLWMATFFVFIISLWGSAGRFLLAYRLMLIGAGLFSGSLFLLVFRDAHTIPPAFIGPLTPLGGLIMISAWLSIIVSILR